MYYVCDLNNFCISLGENDCNNLLCWTGKCFYISSRYWIVTSFNCSSFSCKLDEIDIIRVSFWCHSDVFGLFDCLGLNKCRAFGMIDLLWPNDSFGEWQQTDLVISLSCVLIYYRVQCVLLFSCLNLCPLLLCAMWLPLLLCAMWLGSTWSRPTLVCSVACCWWS